MSKMNVLLMLCLFVSCVAGCGGPPTSTAPPPSLEPFPTATETAESLPQDPGGTEPAPDPGPTEEPASQPTQEVLPNPTAGSGAASPAYDIYVGLSLSGPPCGGYTNSGSFARFSFDSAFHSVRFLPPREEVGLTFAGFNTGSLVPGLTIRGEGQVDGFDFCPAYDGDQERTCAVTKGPKGFWSVLQIEPAGDALPVAGTSPSDLSEELLLTYSMGSAVGRGAILRWECEDFYAGAFGGPFGSMTVSFSLSWNQVMAGEDVTIGATSVNGYGTGEWTLRLVPVAEN